MAMSRPLRILLVDDEPHVQLYMRTILFGCNAEIVGEGKNGDDALAAYAKFQPDLLLMDINMPQKTGLEALDDLLCSTPDARVVLLTSISDQRSIKDALMRGARDYIRKDTPLDEIKEALKKVFDDIRREIDAGTGGNKGESP